MRPTIKFLIGLVLSLGILTWVTAVLVQRTTRRWFENDLRLRAELVVTGSREALSAHWTKYDQPELGRILEEITREDRIMAAAACTADLTFAHEHSRLSTATFLQDIGVHLRHSDGETAETWSRWDASTSLPGGSVFVSAISVENAGQHLAVRHSGPRFKLRGTARGLSNGREFVLLAMGFLRWRLL